jgi:hypothetical protein
MSGQLPHGRIVCVGRHIYQIGGEPFAGQGLCDGLFRNAIRTRQHLQWVLRNLT